MYFCNATTKCILLAISLVLLSACKKETDYFESTPPTDYDNLLKEALLTSSNGQGESFYTLPLEGQYSQIPQDPLNPITHAKVELGRLLFHETGLAVNPRMSEGMNEFSCSSCHPAQAGFQSNLRQGIAEGGVGFGFAGEGRFADPNYPVDSIDVLQNRVPTVMNSAYQKVVLWNGQFGGTGPNQRTANNWPPGTPIFNNFFGFEGVETQAIAGLAVHRMDMNEEICLTYSEYDELFDLCFPEYSQNTRFTKRTAGLAIAAYERTILSNKAPFQRWLRGERTAMSETEKQGAILFFGKAECYSCHNGPALNSMSFHALGMNDLTGPDIIRSNPAAPEHLGRAGFTQDPDDLFKFKTPQLYNLKDSPFYGHGGTFHSVRDVIEYKNNAISENPNVPSTQLAEEFHPLNLTNEEITALTEFIEYGLRDPDLMRYVPNSLPSGNCFPNNDALSQVDQGCVQ